MAYQLVAEVLDHAPSSLSPAEKLLLVALAEVTRIEDNRQCPPVSLQDLARRTNVLPSSLGKVMHRLNEHGLEVRIPLGTNRNGRPVYAVTGIAPSFRLPVLPPPPGCLCKACDVVGRESDHVVGRGSDQPSEVGRGSVAAGRGSVAAGRESVAAGRESDPSRSVSPLSVAREPGSAAARYEEDLRSAASLVVDFLGEHEAFIGAGEWTFDRALEALRLIEPPQPARFVLGFCAGKGRPKVLAAELAATEAARVSA